MEKYRSDNDFHNLDESLGKLTKIDAPLSFEEDLFNKMKTYDSEDNFLLKKFFSFSFISPITGSLILSLLFVIIVTAVSYNGSDPFLAELVPRFDTIRKMIIDHDLLNNGDKTVNVITQKEKILLRERAIEPDLIKISGISSDKVHSSVQYIYRVSDSLYTYYPGQNNYKIVYLTYEEKNQLNEVKKRIFSKIM